MSVGCIREKVNISGCVSIEDCLELQRCMQNSPIRRMCAMFSSSFDSISRYIQKQTLRWRYTVHRTECRDAKHLKLSNEQRYDVWRWRIWGSHSVGLQLRVVRGTVPSPASSSAASAPPPHPLTDRQRLAHLTLASYTPAPCPTRSHRKPFLSRVILNSCSCVLLVWSVVVWQPSG